MPPRRGLRAKTERASCAASNIITPQISQRSYQMDCPLQSRTAGLWGRELERWWQIVDHGYRLRMISTDDLVYEPFFEQMTT